MPPPGESEPAPVLAAEPADAESGEIPEGAKIGEVRIVTQNIFDPNKKGEDRRVFRLANRLHRPTRPGVLQQQLLFQPGDVFSPELIEESERILRRNDYLYDVEIRPVLREDGQVDVEVTSRDVWTLQGGLSFNRSGGENSFGFKLQDTNFLGTGKDMTLQRVTTVDRVSDLVRYRDPNLLGSRVEMLASYADNSDGGRERFEIERPFYSLDTRWAAGFRAMRDDRLDPLYTAGKLNERFRHRNDFYELYGGLSPGLRNGRTYRWRAGFTYEEDRFDVDTSRPTRPNSVLPPDRTLAYPWVSFGSVEDRFVVEHDLDRMQRSEDLNLGRQYHLRLGWSSTAFGGDRDRLVADGAFSAGWRPTPRQLVQANLGGSTRWAEGDAENLLAGGRVRWSLRTWGDHLLVASLGADLARRLDGERQLLLGGDSGLRGYPIRYQEGDRRVLFSLEQRFFSRRELFHLVHVGGAVFFDAGQAWFVETPSQQEREILKDVGFGLRLGSSRSSRAAVVHLDVAFPLDRDDSIKGVQWLVSTRETF